MTVIWKAPEILVEVDCYFDLPKSVAELDSGTHLACKRRTFTSRPDSNSRK